MEQGISPNYPRTFGKAGLTTRPGCPMDGEMHFQMETGNQAAMDHPRRGSRVLPAPRSSRARGGSPKHTNTGLVPLALLAAPGTAKESSPDPEISTK